MQQPPGRKRLGEILVQAGVLAEPQLRAALTEQRRWGGPLGRILVDMKLISEEAMVQALSHQLNLPAVNLDQKVIQPEAIDAIPGELAEQLSVVPFALQGKFLDLAMSDPTNVTTIDTLRTRTRLNIRPYLAGPKSIERALVRCYGRGVGPGVDVQAGPPSVTLQSTDGLTQLHQVTQMNQMNQMNSRVLMPLSDSYVGPLPGGQLGVTAAGMAPNNATAAAAAAAAAGRRDREMLAELAARDLERGREAAERRARIEQLEALIARDEDVLRKLLALLFEKGVATREEIRDRLK